MMVLQRGVDLLQDETGLYNETCVAESYDGNQVIDIKVEEVPYIKEEDDPESVSSLDIKIGHKVSFMAVSPVSLIAVSAVVKKLLRVQALHIQHQLFLYVFKLQ
jgi:hypothetical protein